MIIENLERTVGFINNHEFAGRHKARAYIKFLKWQLLSRLMPHRQFTFSSANGARFIAKRGMTGATGNIYTGLHDFAEMAFLLHFLRKGDCVFDIGANVGMFTVLASGAVGCRTIAFEPDAKTLQHLKTNIELNGMDKLVLAVQKGVGAQKGSIQFTVGGDTTNHVVNDANYKGQLQKIDVVPIDDFKAYKPSLIKIDVEGFEGQILAGGKDVFRDTDLKAVIIELNGSGGRYGYDDKSIHQQFIGWGFQPHSYNPWTRKLCRNASFGDWNTIYVRDAKNVIDRISTAPKFLLWNTAV